jgi:hypothetical protein
MKRERDRKARTVTLSSFIWDVLLPEPNRAVRHRPQRIHTQRERERAAGSKHIHTGALTDRRIHTYTKWGGRTWRGERSVLILCALGDGALCPIPATTSHSRTHTVTHVHVQAQRQSSTDRTIGRAASRSVSVCAHACMKVRVCLSVYVSV